MKGQWPQRNFYAFFSSISLPWEVLPTVTTTTDVDRVRNAVMANASVVGLLVPVRTTPIVILERIVVGEFVRHHTVVGTAELLQALLSAQLFSSPSFPFFPVSVVLVARTTTIVHAVLWSSPANSHNNK